MWKGEFIWANTLAYWCVYYFISSLDSLILACYNRCMPCKLEQGCQIYRSALFAVSLHFQEHEQGHPWLGCPNHEVWDMKARCHLQKRNRYQNPSDIYYVVEIQNQTQNITVSIRTFCTSQFVKDPALTRRISTEQQRMPINYLGLDVKSCTAVMVLDVKSSSTHMEVHEEES